jgi:hypothetical protein
MLPQEDAVVIAVSDCHALVCRYHPLPSGALACECASNADALEGEAIVALATEGTPFEVGEHPCPLALAAQATWD